MLAKLENLIKIQKNQDIIVANPVNHAWYYTTTEGWRIFEMTSRGEKIKEIAQKTSFTPAEIEKFIRDIKSTLFDPKRKVLKERGSVVYLTLNCNMRCKHCRYFSGKGGGDINPSLAKKYIKESIAEKIPFLGITGGEPLTKWSLCREILGYARSLSKDLKFHLLTNGSLVTSDIARELKDLDIWVSVSLDSINEEKFRNFRGFPLPPVLKGIRNLVKEGVRVTIEPVLTKINVNEIEDIVSFAIQEGIPGIHFVFLEKGGRAKENWDELALSDNEIISALSRLMTLYFDKNLRDKILIRDFETMIENIVYSPTSKVCKCAREFSALHIDGKVYPCTDLAGNPKYSLGSIAEKPLREILASKLLKQIPTVDKIKECRSCEVRWLCCGGCKDRADLFYGDFFHPDPYCKVLKWWLKEMLFKTVGLMEQNKL